MSGVKKVEDFLKKKSAGEHIISVLKSVASIHPISGAIATLISDYIPEQRLLRLESFASSVAEELDNFKKEVNVNFITTNEFAFIFEQCFKGAIENYQQERIHGFKSILINSLRENGLTQDEREFYLNLVTRLSVVHIRVLHFMARPDDYCKGRSIPVTNIRGSFSQIFDNIMPDVPLDLIKLSVQELYNLGFTNTDKSIFGTMTSTSGYDLMSGRVTDSGRNFIEFISL